MIISERPREGWSVVNDQGETVALDLELDDELRLAGLAREAIRVIQEARKSSGFDISDRITLVVDRRRPDGRGDHDPPAAHRRRSARDGDHRVDADAKTFTDDELGLGFDLAVV